jgi:6-pyruvoyltetrahydropterin/6-carboxytetrahydropterin synthase
MNKLTKHTIVRQFEIDAGHRIYKHESKCSSVHGHRYRFCVYVSSSDLDELGRVRDFGDVKNRVGSWLEKELDHGMILWEDDPLVAYWQDPHFDPAGQFQNMKLFLLPCQPTAENLASHLLKVANELFSHVEGLTITRVDCWETPNCMASATL